MEHWERKTSRKQRRDPHVLEQLLPLLSLSPFLPSFFLPSLPSFLLFFLHLSSSFSLLLSSGSHSVTQASLVLASLARPTRCEHQVLSTGEQHHTHLSWSSLKVVGKDREIKLVFSVNLLTSVVFTSQCIQLRTYMSTHSRGHLTYPILSCEDQRNGPQRSGVTGRGSWFQKPISLDQGNARGREKRM